jgi:hypothetical protein
MCVDVYQCEYELKIDVPDPHDPHDAVAMLVTNFFGIGHELVR